MTDVFISYARGDRPKAQVMAQALQREGFTVWWDRNIPTGKIFDKVIQEALDSAKCVVVLWSKESIGSRYVGEEADEGFRREISPGIRQMSTVECYLVFSLTEKKNCGLTVLSAPRS